MSGLRGTDERGVVSTCSQTGRRSPGHREGPRAEAANPDHDGDRRIHPQTLQTTLHILPKYVKT